jgi:endonuclease III
MKNAGKYADELKSLLKRLLKEGKPQPPPRDEPLKVLVRGAMSYDMPDKRAEEAMRAIEAEFVDLNELRVATELEVQEFLGTKYPDIEKRVTMITLALNNIFEREHTLSLNRLATISKRDARQFLRELPDIHPFVEAYVMLLCFEGHCVPLDQTMLDYLKSHKAVEPEATLEEATRFVEHHLKADECFDFFQLVRTDGQEDSSDSEGKKKKVKA